MPRMPEFKAEELSPEQRRIYDAIVAGPRGKVEGPLKVWLASPELAARGQELGAFCRFGTSLAKHLSELAIIITGSHWRADFEWHVHAPIAEAAGVPAAAVEAIRTGGTPHFTDPDQQAVYDFAHALLAERRVPDAVYERAVARLGYRGTVDLVGILGYYGLISMTLVTFELPVPPGARPPFADLPPR